jgi:hypothetical protein
MPTYAIVPIEGGKQLFDILNGHTSAMANLRATLYTNPSFAGYGPNPGPNTVFADFTLTALPGTVEYAPTYGAATLDGSGNTVATDAGSLLTTTDPVGENVYGWVVFDTVDLKVIMAMPFGAAIAFNSGMGGIAVQTALARVICG